MNTNSIRASAIASKYAYFNPSMMQKVWLKKPSVFSNVSTPPSYHYNDKTGADAYSWIKEDDDNKKTLFLSFRGTQIESFRDIISDIDIVQVNIKDDIKIHKGFYNQYKSVESSINETIDKAIGKGISKIHCTGHSLGAALATICSIQDTQIPTSLHTFGSPRVGNSDFSNIQHDKLVENIRVMYDMDPVANVPVSCHYQHIKGMCITIDPGYNFDISDGDISIVKRISRKFNINPEYHSIDRYINAFSERNLTRNIVARNLINKKVFETYIRK